MRVQGAPGVEEFGMVLAISAETGATLNTGTTNAQIRLTPELRPSIGNPLFVFARPGE